MTILLTGIAGFIGSHTAKKLLERGDSVVGVDNFNPYYDPTLKESRIKELLAGFDFKLYRQDISDKEGLKKVFQESKIDKICHLAAQAGVRYSLENPDAYISSNIVGTNNLLELAKEFKIKDFVFASSSSVYGGNTKIPFSESDPVDNPVSLYAATKKANELQAHVYHHLYGLNCVGLRFFTVYGPWYRPDMALFKFTKAILAGEPIDVYNQGKHKRDFTYIDDVVAGIIASLDKCENYEIFNLGNNQPVDLEYFIQVTENGLGKKAVKNYLPLQQGDVLETFADIEKARIKLGYEPKIGIEEGIGNFLKWYNDYYQKDSLDKNSVTKEEAKKVCVLGLGYVGLPLAALFSKKHQVIGFDAKQSRIDELKSGLDSTGEVDDIGHYNIEFTSDPQKMKEADFVIVAVPTPIDQAKNPDLTLVVKATETVGRNMKPGAIVIYESTVYPGCTEEICVPILEKESGMKFGEDFKVGYSPERVNPGDKEHAIDKVVKVVSGSDQEALDKVAELYGSVIPAGIHRVSCLKVAEATKVIENVKRDLNIAFVNELSLIFNRVGISTREVLEAAGTKWNFNTGKYFPGLVGGHCIGVDPYYLTHQALKLGYHPQVILAGRATNEYMSRHVAELVLKGIIKQGKIIEKSKVLFMGLTFKENVLDIRNSKAKDIIDYLKEFGLSVYGYDPLLKDGGTKEEFGVDNIDLKSVSEKFDAVIVFSPHSVFKEISLLDLKDKMNENPVLVDIKEFYKKEEAERLGFIYKTL
ncbi:MAG: nucleotide sugar dehydrogenase [Patescibacteria group bacterium]